MGIKEKNMEGTIMGYIGVIWGFRGVGSRRRGLIKGLGLRI